MKSFIYNERKTFMRYDNTRYIAYLNEEIIENYESKDIIPDNVSRTYTAYKYTGTLDDGGTLIECDSPTRDNLINGIIRTRYSQTEEDAIKTHQIEILRNNAPSDKLTEYNLEWSEFNDFRINTISIVDEWLNYNI